MNVEARTLATSPSLLMPYRILAVVGVFLLAMGAIVSPARLWAALLWGGLAVLGIGVAALYFLAIHAVTGAAWATSFKRVPEAMTNLVPVGGLITLVAIALGAARLYPALSVGEADTLPVFKQMWYSSAFYFSRSVAYVGVLSAFAWGLRRISRRQDEDRLIARTHQDDNRHPGGDRQASLGRPGHQDVKGNHPVENRIDEEQREPAARHPQREVGRLLGYIGVPDQNILAVPDVHPEGRHTKHEFGDVLDMIAVHFLVEDTPSLEPHEDQ